MSFCSTSLGEQEITVQCERLGLGGALYNRKITLHNDTSSKNQQTSSVEKGMSLQKLGKIPSC